MARQALPPPRALLSRVTLTTGAGKLGSYQERIGYEYRLCGPLGTAAVTATTTGGFPVGIGETVGVSRNPFTGRCSSGNYGGGRSHGLLHGWRRRMSIPLYISLMGMSMLINVEKKAKGGGGPGAAGSLYRLQQAQPPDNQPQSLAVSTTVSAGTMFWVVSTNATPPNAAQIELGLDSANNPGAASGNAAVTTSPFAASATGLIASTTYFAYFVQTSAGGAHPNRCHLPAASQPAHRRQASSIR